MFSKFFLALCLFMITNSFSAQEINKYKQINWRIYHSANWRDYVDYESEEWKKIPYREKNSLLQIPDEELNTMLTDELIEVSVDCFYARDFVMFASINRYYNSIYTLFNGFREMTQRPDVCEKIIRYYKYLQVDSEILSPAGLTTRDHNKILEYFIVHPEILSKFSPVELHQLLNSLKDKYIVKKSMTDVYTEKDIIPNIYALARILEKLDQQTNIRIHNIENIDLFLDSGRMLTRETRDQILSICNGF